MIVGPGIAVLRIVFKPLLAQHRNIEPVGELRGESLLCLGRDALMIADAHKKRRGAKRSDLVLNEIRPSEFQVDVARQCVSGLAGLGRHVFVNLVDGAKITQMPVEAGSVAGAVRGNRGHHHISAIARITGDNETPGARSVRLTRFLLS